MDKCTSSPRVVVAPRVVIPGIVVIAGVVVVFVVIPVAGVFLGVVVPEVAYLHIKQV